MLQEECSKLCIIFVIAQILLKIGMKPETALLGVEGEEEKCTYSFHMEKQVPSESRVSGNSVQMRHFKNKFATIP